MNELSSLDFPLEDVAGKAATPTKSIRRIFPSKPFCVSQFKIIFAGSWSLVARGWVYYLRMQPQQRTKWLLRDKLHRDHLFGMP